jgi:hypothetical protein
MYEPQTYGAACLMIAAMLCWGSWANTMKFAPKWPLQLFYWDCVVGVLLASIAAGVTLGSTDDSANSCWRNIGMASGDKIAYALAAGVVFNVANLLLVAAISIAGLAVAFPVGIGLALVVGVILNYVLSPAGNPIFLFGGVALVSAAIIVDAMAFRARDRVVVATDSDLLVLIVGEAGSGRSDVGKFIHDSGTRQGRKPIVVTCGSGTPEQIELNFFGCAAGAFEGVEKARVGWLELARGSTLVLCNVEKLPVVNQRQLRRHRYRRSETAQFLGLSRKTLYSKICATELYPESAKSDRP